MPGLDANSRACNSNQPSSSGKRRAKRDCSGLYRQARCVQSSSRDTTQHSSCCTYGWSPPRWKPGTCWIRLGWNRTKTRPPLGSSLPPALNPFNSDAIASLGSLDPKTPVPSSSTTRRLSHPTIWISKSLYQPPIARPSRRLARSTALPTLHPSASLSQIGRCFQRSAGWTSFWCRKSRQLHPKSPLQANWGSIQKTCKLLFATDNE